MNTISCLFGMQIQKKEPTEGLPELNKHHDSRLGAKSAGTQPSTSNTALFEISDYGRDEPTETILENGKSSVAQRNLSLLISFTPGNNK